MTENTNASASGELSSDTIKALIRGCTRYDAESDLIDLCRAVERECRASAPVAAAPEITAELTDEIQVALDKLADEATSSATVTATNALHHCRDAILGRGRYAAALQQRPAPAPLTDLSKLQRWTFDGGMTACASPDGQWVAYADIEWRFLAQQVEQRPAPAQASDELRVALSVFDMGLGFALCHREFGATREAIKKLQKDFAAICELIAQQAEQRPAPAQAAVRIDWPACNEACDEGAKSVTCRCEAARKSLAQQAAAAPAPCSMEEWDAGKIAKLPPMCSRCGLGPCTGREGAAISQQAEAAPAPTAEPVTSTSAKNSTKQPETRMDTSFGTDVNSTEVGQAVAWWDRAAGGFYLNEAHIPDTIKTVGRIVPLYAAPVGQAEAAAPVADPTDEQIIAAFWKQTGRDWKPDVMHSDRERRFGQIFNHGQLIDAVRELLRAAHPSAEGGAAGAMSVEDVDDAIRVASHWRNGKLLGGDPYEVCETLLGEVERLRAAAPAVALPAAKDLPLLLNADELAALRRFNECSLDGEGYDVPKEMMQRLAEVGVVRRKSGAYYEHTEYGLAVLEAAPTVGPNLDALVNRFLGWPLPASLSANLPGIERPIGTHLMDADTAKALFAYCLDRAALADPQPLKGQEQ